MTGADQTSLAAFHRTSKDSAIRPFRAVGEEVMGGGTRAPMPVDPAFTGIRILDPAELLELFTVSRAKARG